MPSTHFLYHQILCISIKICSLITTITSKWDNVKGRKNCISFVAKKKQKLRCEANLKCDMNKI